jgi:hypothetical protein
MKALTQTQECVTGLTKEARVFKRVKRQNITTPILLCPTDSIKNPSVSQNGLHTNANSYPVPVPTLSTTTIYIPPSNVFVNGDASESVLAQAIIILSGFSKLL